MDTKLVALCDELESFQAKNDLERECAQEQLNGNDKLTQAQISWLKDFCIRWCEACES